MLSGQIPRSVWKLLWLWALGHRVAFSLLLVPNAAIHQLCDSSVIADGNTKFSSMIALWWRRGGGKNKHSFPLSDPGCKKKKKKTLLVRGCGCGVGVVVAGKQSYFSPLNRLLALSLFLCFFYLSAPPSPQLPFISWHPKDEKSSFKSWIWSSAL